MKAVLRSIVIAAALFTLAMGLPGTGSAEPGDVDGVNNTGNGTVDVFDALMTLQYAVGLYQPANDLMFTSAADVAPLAQSDCKPLGDNKVDVFDALAILRHAVNLDPWNGTCPPTYTISGKVTVTPGGAPLAGASITATDKSVFTQNDGAYSLSGVAGGTFTLTPARSGYTFTPAKPTVTVTANVTQNFTATSLSFQELTINKSGSSDAASANYVFRLQSVSSDYTYTITHFGIHDRLVFPAGDPAPSVNNDSFEDGRVLVYMRSPGGGMITVELTGLTQEQDQIVGPHSFNQVFLPGALTQQ